MQVQINHYINGFLTYLLLAGLFLLPACINNNLGNRFIDAANGEWGLKVFLSSSGFTGNFLADIPAEPAHGTNCTGTAIEMANCWCTKAARDSLITLREKKIYAWLSDISTDAVCNIQGLIGKNCSIEKYSNVPYISVAAANPDFFPIIADNLENLISGKLSSSVSTFTSLIWTGSNNQGIGQSDNCQNWTSADGGGAISGVYGQPNNAANWSQISIDACNVSKNILCFEGPLN
ncbi:MAG: DUF1554 domain-containing protein [Leptospiraceae bacterium]|nr:DUF1554 domain-containing protein [Leptospiraceae bacterium]